MELLSLHKWLCDYIGLSQNPLAQLFLCSETKKKNIIIVADIKDLPNGITVQDICNIIDGDYVELN